MYFASNSIHTRKNIRLTTIKQLWVGLIPFAIHLVFPENEFFKNPLVGISSLVTILCVKLVFPDKVNLISSFEIDEGKKKIIIAYFNDYDGDVRKAYDFNAISITVNRKWWGTSQAIKSISLYPRRGPVYYITESKDGFDKEVLRDAAAYLEMITSPVGK